MISYRLPVSGHRAKNSETSTAVRVIDFQGPVTGIWYR